MNEASPHRESLPMVMAGALGECKKQGEEGSSLAQIAEVHMKGMNLVSLEACTFPYKEG